MARLFLGLIFISGLLTSGGSLAGSTHARGYDPRGQVNRAAFKAGPARKVRSNPNKASGSARMPEYAPDEVIFKLADTKGQGSGQLPRAHKTVQQRLQQVARKHRFIRTSKVFTKRPRGLLRDVHRARLPAGVSPHQALEQLKADLAVQWAEFNYYRYTQETTPNDPNYSSQQHLERIKASTAWDVTTGDANTVIAVVDTGVDWDHPDLAANIWTNKGEIEGDGIDNDENGYIDDVRGWDFVSADANEVYSGEDPGPPDNDPNDFHGHGTHVSGIAAAVGNNGVGVSGVSWHSKIMPLRAGYKHQGGRGRLRAADIAVALEYAADNGANIINMSFGSSSPSQVERIAIDYAISQGCVLTAAAGNGASDGPIYPASFNGVLSVAATSETSDSKPAFSNYGLSVDVAAPGLDIYSTLLGGDYGNMSGTSMASPAVAGLAALIKSAHPEWGREQIVNQIIATADDIDDANPLFAGKLGGGRVNAARAVGPEFGGDNLNLVNTQALDTGGDHDDELEPGETVSLYATIKNFAGPRNISATLTSADPYVTIANRTASYGIINQNRAVTNFAEAFTFHIDPNTPADHVAAFDVEICANAIPVRRKTIELTLTPTWRNPQIIGTGRIQSGKAFERMPDGRLLAIMSLDVSDAGIFATIRELNGTWSPLEQISEMNNDPYVDFGPDGDAHVVFGSDEVFYVRYDTATETWSSPVQLTTEYERLPSSNLYYFTVCADSNDLIHVAWPDYRNGRPQIYYSYHDGSAWQPEQVIYDDIDPNIPGAVTLRMFDTSDGKRHLFGTFWESGSRQYYVMSGSGTAWDPPHMMTSLHYQGLPLRSGDQIYVLYKETARTDPLELAEFDGADWVHVETIGDVNGSNWNLSIPGDGTMRLSYQLGPEIYWMVKDAGIWSDPLMVNPAGKYYSDPDMVTDTDYFDHIIVEDLGGYKGVGGYPVKKPVYLTSAPIDAALLPPRPTVVDDADKTTDPNSVNLSWSSTHATGIAGYVYALGTAPGEVDMRHWTSAGADTNTTVDLSETPMTTGQDYYCTVRAHSNGVYSSPLGVTDGIFYQPASATGVIALDRDAYSCSDAVSIVLADLDLQGQATQEVNLATDGGDFETVTLGERPVGSGIFEASVATSGDFVNVEDGTLQVAHGDTVIATYEDVNDGTGNSPIAQDSAAVDCAAPAISNVQISSVLGEAATVTFSTNEPACGTVRYGLSPGSFTETAVGDCDPCHYSVDLYWLEPNTTYFFKVDVSDDQANSSTDDNAGSCYTFTTLDAFHFPDANLQAVVEEQLGISSPTRLDMLGLTSLDAHSLGIVDTTGLEWAKNLTELYLNINQINDINALSGLTDLERLYLSSNRISGIDALSGLTNLAYLSLSENQIANISAISGFKNLTTLYLHSNHVDDINALSGLTNLTYLSLSDNQITDISAVSELKNLKTLYLVGNYISDIDAISGLTNLEGLYLSRNQIGNINALSGLKNLIHLSLRTNQITDISVMSRLDNLINLYLVDNHISDISSVSDLMKLRSLDLRGNPLDTAAHCVYLPSIRDNNPLINLSYDPNPNPLTKDCSVEFRDYAEFASNWLETGCGELNNWCGGADLNHINDVDLSDLAELVQYWLQATE